MCVFLSVYICGCKGSKLVSMKQRKNDAQNSGKCAIFGDFCKESGKFWGKMKKKWENVWWSQNNFVPLHRLSETSVLLVTYLTLFINF